MTQKCPYMLNSKYTNIILAMCRKRFLCNFYFSNQVLGGAFQAFGWPGVVTVMANWFGKGKKGLLFGIWNSHTSVGNILGGILAGIIPTTQLLILEAIKCSLI